jgi:hypothetical protein
VSSTPEPVTALTTHRARITGPVAYRSGSGRKQNIPIGPCLVESMGGRSIDVIWGTRGQSSVALTLDAIKAARDDGHLVLLD